MSTSLLYHGFGIVGYHYLSQDFQGGQVTFRIEQPRRASALETVARKGFALGIEAPRLQNNR